MYLLAKYNIEANETTSIAEHKVEEKLRYDVVQHKIYKECDNNNTLLVIIDRETGFFTVYFNHLLLKWDDALKLNVLRNVLDVEKWAGNAYQTGDEVDLALINIRQLIGINR